MNNVKIFAQTIETEAKEQIQRLAMSEAYRHCKIRIMPDCHAGKGCTIGTVIQIDGRVIPNTVGVDIGCGMQVYVLGKKNINLSLLDRIINEEIPSGFNVREKAVDSFAAELMCRDIEAMERGLIETFNFGYIMCSIGTLGGGNHFIEVDEDDEGCKYLVVHSGSRNLGVKVCRYYQELAEKSISKNNVRKRVIENLKAQGREKEINDTLRLIPTVDKELAYLEGSALSSYLGAMRTCQEYAALNREIIADTIINSLGNTDCIDRFCTIHNYIDTYRGIIRKGAVSAELGNQLIIPLNMRDGSLICIGMGNLDWLRSAPHGAGRLMSRSKAKKMLSMSEYEKQMSGVYSSSVCEETIDESPMAYKSADEIISLIGDTVKIVRRIRPIYNFKAKE